MRTRIGWASAIAVLGLAFALVLSGVSGAGATQGQPVIAGAVNTETSETVLHNTAEAATCGGGPFGASGLAACGFQGVYGEGVIGLYGSSKGSGAVQGVFGFTDQADGWGVRGRNAGGGVGILGFSNGGAGVRGEGGVGGTGLFGTGSTGVYGEGTENGVQAQGGTFGVFAEGTDYGTYSKGPSYGVFGQASTNTGVGVAAVATGSGRGLSVIGKAEFSRSGRAVVQSGQSSVTVSNVSLSAKSLVLATAQKSVAGIYVQAAVPNVNAKTITIYLNGSVGANYPVAWFIVERP